MAASKSKSRKKKSKKKKSGKAPGTSAAFTSTVAASPVTAPSVATSSPRMPLTATAAPLPTEILTAPRSFGFRLRQASTAPWHYWAVPVVAAALAGLAYALLMRPGLNLAAAEALRAAGQSNAPAPTSLSHVTNAFGTFFLTLIMGLVMWGLGQLGTGKGQPARTAEIYSASFALMVPLYVLSILVTLLTPATTWALNPAEVTRAGGHLLELQRAALHSTSHSFAATLLVLVSFLGTLGQFVLAYLAFRETTGNQTRAARGVLFPILPALLIQVLSVGALFLNRG